MAENAGYENIKPFIRKKGAPALPGAGRPPGAANKLPALPPIHVDAMPFKVLTLKKGESAADYWNRQVPITLKYLLRRFDAFIVYTEKGVFDPMGAKIFELLGKELVKEIRVRGKAAKEAAKEANPDEGREVKRYRKFLLSERHNLAADGETINDDVEQPGIFNVLPDAAPGVDQLEDEF